MLDNRRMALVEDVHVRNYRPLFVFDQSGIMTYADAPLLAHAAERDSTPATAARPGLIAAVERTR
jgi:hypothetical protein